MKTLIIETSTEKSCLTLMDGDKKISLPLPNGPELSKRLALEVSNLLKTHSFLPERIAAGEGPGSFTGIRVGIALARALALGWDLPLIEFCSMKLFSPSEDGRFAVLIDARIGGIYALKGEKEKEKITYDEKPTLYLPDQLEAAIQDIPLLISPHPQLIEKRINRACIEASPRPENIPSY